MTNGRLSLAKAAWPALRRRALARRPFRARPRPGQHVLRGRGPAERGRHPRVHARAGPLERRPRRLRARLRVAGGAGRDPGGPAVSSRRDVAARARQRPRLRVRHHQLQQERPGHPPRRRGREGRGRRLRPPSRARPRHTYLVGASEGGLVTALAVERTPRSSRGASRPAARSATSAGRSTTGATSGRSSTCTSRVSCPGRADDVPQSVRDGWESVYLPRITAAARADAPPPSTSCCG